MSNYKWSWWLIFSILAAIILIPIGQVLPIRSATLKDTVIYLLWSVWLFNTLYCIFKGTKL